MPIMLFIFLSFACILIVINSLHHKIDAITIYSNRFIKVCSVRNLYLEKILPGMIKLVNGARIECSDKVFKRVGYKFC